MSEDKTIPEKPKPNVWLAHAAAPATVSGKINTATGEPIELPFTEKEQRAGFYLERAAELIRLYPDRYKRDAALAQPPPKAAGETVVDNPEGGGGDNA